MDYGTPLHIYIYTFLFDIKNDKQLSIVIN